MNDTERAERLARLEARRATAPAPGPAAARPVARTPTGRRRHKAGAARILAVGLSAGGTLGVTACLSLSAQRAAARRALVTTDAPIADTNAQAAPVVVLRHLAATTVPAAIATGQTTEPATRRTVAGTAPVAGSVLQPAATTNPRRPSTTGSAAASAAASPAPPGTMPAAQRAAAPALAPPATPTPAQKPASPPPPKPAAPPTTRSSGSKPA